MSYNQRVSQKGIQKNIGEMLPPGTEARRKLREQLHPRVSHGGVESRGKRKTKRPFVLQAPIHLTLASDRAKGIWALSHRKNAAKVSSMIYAYGSRFKIRIYRASVTGGEIHLLVKAMDRKNLADFLRVLAGRVAILITGARKHQKKVGKFWRDLCWSKLINWGADFFQVRSRIASLQSGTESKKKESKDPLLPPVLLSLAEGLP